MRIFLDTVGCRLNQSEIEGFANLFRALGHQVVGDPAQADVAIVNTCAVTAKAAADSRKKLRRASREGAQLVVATGCWATLEPVAAQNLEGVHSVFINDRKDGLVADILDITPERISAIKLVREPLPGNRGRTRAFIKVQEGCDNRCTYCLTRLARGPSRSRNLSAINTDVQAAIDGGAKEIVLTGVQLGAWGKDFDEPQGLIDLLVEILSHQDMQRLRLSSIEPWEFDLEMLSLWQDQRLCRQLHIPLQSGSDRILKKMGRPIRVSSYKNLVENIQKRIPDIAITTDVITGFPGETDGDFEATQSLVREVGFAGGHVFTYSPRPGTPAFNMGAQVPTRVAKRRNAALRNMFEDASKHFRDQFINKKRTVLWEISDPIPDGKWTLSGLTDNYLRVYAVAECDLWNTITTVQLSAHHPERPALVGQIDGLKRGWKTSGA
jgi:threonylcarbamoyladenosine tRNA methylthiotransferase MtaB